MNSEERINEKIKNYKEQFYINDIDKEFYLRAYCEFQQLYNNKSLSCDHLKKEILSILFEIRNILNLERKY